MDQRTLAAYETQQARFQAIGTRSRKQAICTMPSGAFSNPD
jgi:hypothetical protein